MVPRILVTGANGFVGRQTVETLLRLDCEVHATGRTQEVSFGCPWHRADLHDAGDRQRLIEKVRPSHLVHLAWETTHGGYWESPENRVWLESSRELFMLFRNFGGKRIVAAGSCAEYEWGSGVYSEDQTPLHPRSAYGIHKNNLRQFLEDQRFAFAWGRLFYLYGPGEKKERLVPSIILPLLHGREAVVDSPDRILDLLHVRDAGEAFARLVFCDSVGAFNIASGVGVSIRTVAQRIAEQVGSKTEIRWGTALRSGSDQMVADISRMVGVGWKPTLELRQGLMELVRWWEGQRK